MSKMEDLPGRKYTIDKDIPIPEGRRRGRTQLTMLAQELKVGESILVEKSRRTLATNFKKVTGFEFCQRVVSKTEMRIWRIK